LYTYINTHVALQYIFQQPIQLVEKSQLHFFPKGLIPSYS